MPSQFVSLPPDELEPLRQDRAQYLQATMESPATLTAEAHSLTAWFCFRSRSRVVLWSRLSCLAHTYLIWSFSVVFHESVCLVLYR